MVIHIIELGLPIWFCCSLWNFKRPTSLWLLNPSLLLQPRAIVNDTNNSESVTSPLLSSELPKDYGTITDERENATKGEVPDCWICLDSGDTSDLFKPCSCPAVHRECLNKWIKERATNTSHKSALQCQVCKKRYGVVKTKFHCITKDLTIKHWLIGVGLFVLFVVVSCLSSLVQLVSSTSGRVAVVCAVIIVDAIILKFMGFCALWAYKRSRVTQLILVGDPIQISMELKHDKDIHPPTQLTIQQTTLSLQ